MGLGVGFQGCSAKMKALLHCLHLETSTWHDARALMRSVSSFTSDSGAELMLANIPSFNPEDVFPYMSRHVCSGMTDETTLPDISDLQPIDLCFDHALVVPGTEHLLHTSLGHVCNTLHGFGKWLRAAKSLAQMMSSRMYRDRIKWRLFSDPIGLQSHSMFDRYFQRFCEHRFLSLKVFTTSILAFEALLKCRFDGSKIFNSRSASSNAPASRYLEEEEIVGALNSVYWWGYCKMLHGLMSPLEGICILSRTCSCHCGTRPHIFWSTDAGPPQSSTGFTDGLRAHAHAASKVQCVRKGLRAAEFATGVPFEIFAECAALTRDLLCTAIWLTSLSRVVTALCMTTRWVFNIYVWKLG